MAKRYRPVADRHRSLEPTPPGANFTLAGVRLMSEGGGGKEISCTIIEYCRTQIFEFPGIDFHPDGEEPHHTIYSSPTVNACVASNLETYFESAAFSKQYSIDPSLRHVVSESEEKVKSQQKRVPVFLVIEESNKLTPVEMFKGECTVSDEVVKRDGKQEPILVGGREGEEFITAWHTVDGAWPDLPKNQVLVNTILAGVRAGQETPEPIRKFVDESCLVTSDGRFVLMVRPTMTVRGIN